MALIGQGRRDRFPKEDPRLRRGLATQAYVPFVGAGWDVDLGDHTITATQFVSSVATGTAPFVVASTTVVTNLNADRLDGLHSSSFVTSVTGTAPIVSSGGQTPAISLTFGTGLQNDGGTLKTKDSEIVHDNLSGFVAAEHYDWTNETHSILTTGNITVDSDASALVLGDGQDAKIYYDGTNLRINAKVVGSGGTQLTGNVGIGVAPGTPYLCVGPYARTTYNAGISVNNGAGDPDVAHSYGAQIEVTTDTGAGSSSYDVVGLRLYATVQHSSGVQHSVYGVSGQAVCQTNANISNIYGLDYSAWYRGTGQVSNIYGLNVTHGIYPGQTGTAGFSHGLRINTNVGDTPGNITTCYGWYMVDATGTGSIGTFYGIYLAQLTKGGVNWQIYSIGGNVALGGYTRFGGITTPTCAVDITGDMAATGDVKAATFHVGADAGIDATVPVAPVLPLTVAGSMTFKKGLLTAYTPPS